MKKTIAALAHALLVSCATVNQPPVVLVRADVMILDGREYRDAGSFTAALRAADVKEALIALDGLTAFDRVEAAVAAIKSAGVSPRFMLVGGKSAPEDQ